MRGFGKLRGRGSFGIVALLLLSAVLIPILQNTNVPSAEAHNAGVPTISAYGTPSINGVMSPGEWASCYGPNTYTGNGVYTDVVAGVTTIYTVTNEPVVTLTFCEQNDQINDYYAFQINGIPSNPADTMYLLFDNLHTGTVPSNCGPYISDDALGFVPTGGPQQSFVDMSYCGLPSPHSYSPPPVTLDTSHGTTQDGTGVISYSATNGYVFEMSHPMNSHDPYDYALSPGSTVGWCVYFSDANSHLVFDYPLDCSLVYGGTGSASKYGDIKKLPNPKTTTTTTNCTDLSTGTNGDYVADAPGTLDSTWKVDNPSGNPVSAYSVSPYVSLGGIWVGGSGNTNSDPNHYVGNRANWITTDQASGYPSTPAPVLIPGTYRYTRTFTVSTSSVLTVHAFAADNYATLSVYPPSSSGNPILTTVGYASVYGFQSLAGPVSVPISPGTYTLEADVYNVNLVTGLLVVADVCNCTDLSTGTNGDHVADAPGTLDSTWLVTSPSGLSAYSVQYSPPWVSVPSAFSGQANWISPYQSAGSPTSAPAGMYKYTRMFTVPSSSFLTVHAFAADNYATLSVFPSISIANPILTTVSYPSVYGFNSLANLASVSISPGTYTLEADVYNQGDVTGLLVIADVCNCTGTVTTSTTTVTLPGSTVTNTTTLTSLGKNVTSTTTSTLPGSTSTSTTTVTSGAYTTTNSTTTVYDGTTITSTFTTPVGGVGVVVTTTYLLNATTSTIYSTYSYGGVTSTSTTTTVYPGSTTTIIVTYNYGGSTSTSTTTVTLPGSTTTSLWTTTGNCTTATPSTKSTVSVTSSSSQTSSTSTSGGSPRCVIATAAYGSDLAAPVQFLRNFRDNEVQKTILGTQFMTAFNHWYYSWAPAVAQQIAPNENYKAATRAFITPLIGGLFVGQTLFAALVPISPELAILSAGLLASAIIGLIYLTPAYALAWKLSKRKITRRTIYSLAIAAAILTFIATLTTGTFSAATNLTALAVVEAMLLSPALILQKITSPAKNGTRA